VLIRTDPRTGLEGKPSLEFCAASAMLDGRLGRDAFTDERVRDARVPEPGAPACSPSHRAMSLRDEVGYSASGRRRLLKWWGGKT
jgi:hypothetical protein